MKKLIFILAAITTFGFTSCKKDYTCVCTENGQTEIELPFQNTRRPDASTACKAAEMTWGGECKLK